MSMCIYQCLCVYIYLSMSMCIYQCLCVYTNVYVYIPMSMCIYLCYYIFVCPSKYLSISVNLHDTTKNKLSLGKVLILIVTLEMFMFLLLCSWPSSNVLVIYFVYCYTFLLFSCLFLGKTGKNMNDEWQSKQNNFVTQIFERPTIFYFFMTVHLV